MLFNKRGVLESETVHVTGLVILIAILIILYMLLIPPEAQRDILEKGGLEDKAYIEPAQNSNSLTQTKGTKNILLESPGLVFPDSSKKETIKIPSVNLFSVTSQKIINLVNSLSVSRSLFSNNFQDISFKLDDLENLKGIKLFFNTLNSKGNLIIYLNNNIIFKGLASNEVLPLEIPVSNLNNQNILRFEVSSPDRKSVV